MIKEAIFLGAEQRVSKRTGNAYWVAAFLDGMSTVEMFLTEELVQQVINVKNMTRVKLQLELRPNRDKQYQVNLAGVAAV